MKLYVSLTVFSLMVVSATIWIIAKPVVRPKYNSVQTLVAGAMWSQMIFTVGDFITHLNKPNPYKIVAIYFLATSILLITGTAIVLVRILKLKPKPKLY